MIRKLTPVVMLLTTLVYAQDKPKPQSKPELDKDLKIEILKAQRQFLSDINAFNDARAKVDQDNNSLVSLIKRANDACGFKHKVNPVTLDCEEVPDEKTIPTPAPAAKPSK